jgi:hypothetical protein
MHQSHVSTNHAELHHIFAVIVVSSVPIIAYIILSQSEVISMSMSKCTIQRALHSCINGVVHIEWKPGFLAETRTLSSGGPRLAAKQAAVFFIKG